MHIKFVKIQQSTMIFSVCVYVLFCFASLAHGVPEVVWLEDLTPNHELRHLEIGLPQRLEFNVKRGTKTVISLRLEENRRLNANAPVFESVMEGNKQRVIKRVTEPIRDVKFYHDKRNAAALQVSCAVLLNGPCQRVIEGSLSVNGDSYEIKPASDSLTARWLGSGTSISHLLEKVEFHHNLHGDRQLGIFGTDYKLVKDDDGPEDHDHVPIPDTRDASDHDYVPIPDKPNVSEYLLEELRSLINEEDLDIELMNILSGKRQKRQMSTGQFAIEVYMVVDPSVWNKYYAVTSGNNTDARDQNTQYVLRKKLAHIMNGVSLRYEMIENPKMNVYVTISGFEFYKIVNSNPLFPTYKIIKSGGIDYVDSDVYITGLAGWVRTQPRLANHDHIMVITGYELIYDGDIKKTAVAGVAYVNGACSSYRVSVQEDGSYFVLTSVAAHELGHNVGAIHDGNGSTVSCPADQQYIMAPYVASFGPNIPYTINPWRFSKCSVAAFISFFNSVQCLKDEGDYWNKNEWDEDNSKLPGELYSAEEQCGLLYGSQSGLCYLTSKDERICRAMGCIQLSICRFQPAAQGTPCGASLNKWCIDGLCQEKQNGGTTKASTTSTTASTTSTTAKTTSTTAKTTSTTASTTSTTAKTTSTTAKTTSTTAKTTYTTTKTTSTTAKTTSTTESEMSTTTTESSTMTMEGESCVDIGWKDWNCKKVSDYFYANYKFKPSYWCRDSYWAKACCALCAGGDKTSTMPEACVDIGYSTYTCEQVATAYQTYYGLLPRVWCRNAEFNNKCCRYCRANGA